MATIPNLNVVIQQGHAALESQNVKTPAQDSSQFSVQQVTRDEENRTTVNQSNQADRVDKDKKESDQRGKKYPKRAKKKTKPEKDPDDTGRILDTVA